MKLTITVLIGLGLAAMMPAQQPQRRPAQPSTAAVAPQETAPLRPEDRGGVSGTISNAATGELLRKANVLLRRADARGGGMAAGYGGGAGIYAATTDASGAYSITGVDPGTYILTAQRGGFVDQRYGAKGPGLAGSTITVGKSQYVRDISVAMTPHGVIAGKVTDEDGDAVANANVQVLRRTYVRGRKQLIPADNASTNDLGEYRVFGLPPGKYYVSSAYRRNFRASGSQDSAQETYATTFYPGAPTPEMATPVQVAAGGQLTGIDVRLRKVHIVRVSGRVIGGGGAGDGRGRGGGVTVTLMPKEAVGMASMPNQARPYNAQGDFVLYNVTPGSYFLTARSMDSGKLMAARVPVEVGSAPVDNVALQLSGGVDLTGRVKVEGSDTVTGNVRVSLTLRQGIAMGGGPPPQPGATKEDGSFVVSSVQPDVYDVRVVGVPDGGYVRSVLFGNAEVLDTGLDFTNGVISGDLTVSIRMAAAQVEGTVQNEKGEPAGSAVVVLVPQGARREGDRYYMTTTSDSTGHYTLKNITPGEYRVYAFDTVENSAYMDPEWMLPYEGKGEAVSLRDNGRETVALRLLVAGGA